MTGTDESDARSNRAVRNQSAAREQNEHLLQGQVDSAFVEFTCECTLKVCGATVCMSVEEYEDVRKFSTQFVVATGHVVPGDVLVRETARYQVVQKVGDAAEVATKLSPRRASASASESC